MFPACGSHQLTASRAQATDTSGAPFDEFKGKRQQKQPTKQETTVNFLTEFFEKYGTTLGGNDGNGTNLRRWVPGLTWRRLYNLHFGAHWRSLHPVIPGCGNTKSARRRRQVPGWSTFMRSKDIYQAAAKYMAVFAIKTEQKVCPDCFRFAELLKPADLGEVELEGEDRELAQRGLRDHKRFADAERAASEERVAECKRLGGACSDFVLSFDAAKALPALKLRQTTSDATQVKCPVQWMFVSMFNANLDRMRFVTSTIDFNKGANFQCSLVWEEILLMWRRAEQMKATAKGTVPQVCIRALSGAVD